MDFPDIKINLCCLFCRSDILVEEGRTFQSGDLLPCQECSEKNDYDSLIEVAKEKGIKQVKGELEKAIKKEFASLFKKG